MANQTKVMRRKS